MTYYPSRKLTVLALDPSVRSGGKLLRTQIEIPNEYLESGPRGYRVHVIDYDSTRNLFRKPSRIPKAANRQSASPLDPFERWTDEALLSSPDFRAAMAYGIIMKTLARFEYALGRRLKWSFRGHQIQVAPHAFAEANAFYSDAAQGLFFGYFPSADGKRTIHSCLSHEVIAHETTHALLDGLRERYTDPSSPQQAGFHEGFADVIALLSILSAQSVVERVVDLGLPTAPGGAILRRNLTPERLKLSGLFGLAQEMGSELAGVHGHALRRSIMLPPRADYLSCGDYDEPHACGEVLTAAVLNAFLGVWVNRLHAIGDRTRLDRERAAEEGAELAGHLLTFCIRAIDFCPPTDITFGDFASALLTADAELNPRDTRYGLRATLLQAFRDYGIEPTSRGSKGRQAGSWDPPPEAATFVYDRTHFESMKTDPDELFRFLWENRQVFKLHGEARTRVLSVRPFIQTGRDGFILRETVAEYHQQIRLFARELKTLGITKPKDMPNDLEIDLFGGNAVIFDEYGHVKYSIGKSILDAKRQTKRLRYLWENGFFDAGASKTRTFSRLHLRRGTDWYRALKSHEHGRRRN